MKLALAMIVAARDQEAEPLARCLSYVAEYVDGIFITVTGHNEKVEAVCDLYQTHISHFDWTHDFSAARNFNFSQVPQDYTHILWLDADDCLRGAEKLRQVLEENPDVDAFSMMYLYGFDERNNPTVVHQKTQIIKNTGFTKWTGRLHEDFTPNREFKTYLIKGIDRLHLTDEFRVDTAKQRNLDISLKEMESNPDDPRVYWNVGNSQKACGLFQDSIQTFNKFLELSQSDEEKYIAHLRLAESYWGLKQHTEAIDTARYAIGIRPDYPDAYHLLGNIYFDTKNYQGARDMYLMGLTKRPPYYSIIVYNPRDYDYTPLMNLAKTYFQLSLPQMALICLEQCVKITPDDKHLKQMVKLMKAEADKAEKVVKKVAKLRKIKNKAKLQDEINALPIEIRSHPAVCNLYNINFHKENSSGKDLVIFCGFTDEAWTPETAKTKGIGGSEEAVIWLSKLLAEKGWNVSVYNNCGHKEQTFDGVTYKPFWSWNYRDKQDVTILWRAPRYLDYDVNSDKVYLDMHDALPPGEFTKERIDKVDKIFVKSKFHRSLYPDVPDEKFVIIPNGIDAQLFTQNLERDPNLLINTSSPDRSLSALLDCYEEIKKEVPQAKLKWAYGWHNFDALHSSNAKMMEWKQRQVDRMKELGVEELGRVSHEDVAKLYLTANIFAYPSEFAEIDCISARKAESGGAIPVTTDFAALGETVQFGTKIHSDKTKDTWAAPYQFDFALSQDKQQQWVEAVVDLLKNPPTEEQRRPMREWTHQFDWAGVVNRWDETFEANLLKE